MKPRQPPARERCQFHQAPTTSLGDVDRAVSWTSDHRPRRRFFTYAARVSSLQGMQDDLSARRALRVRAVLRPARGRVRAALEQPIPPSCAAGSRPGRTRCGATATSCPVQAPPAGHAARRAGRRCCGPTGSPSSSASTRCGSRTTPPTRRTRSRTASCRSRSPAPASSASRRSPARRPATSPTPSPPTPPPPGLESYVFIPADLEEQKVLATGVYGTNLVAVRGNYDDVNRLCTELSGEHEWAFVNINMRPYYAEGSKTLAFETAEQLGLRAARPGRRADRVGLAVHEDRARVRGVDRARAARRASCRRSTAPRPPAARRSRPRSRPGRTSAGRSSRTRSPSRWRSATRPTGPTRSTSRAAPAARSTSVTDDEIREGIKLLARTTGIFTETAGGVTVAVLAKLAERGDIDPDERVVAYITGEGLKTLDVRARDVRGVGDRADARRRSRRPASVSSRWRDKTARAMAVTVKIPTQLRAATDGEATRERRRLDGRRGARRAVRALRRAAQPDRRGRRPAPVRQRLRRRRGHPLPRRPRHARRGRRRGDDPAGGRRRLILPAPVAIARRRGRRLS